MVWSSWFQRYLPFFHRPSGCRALPSPTVTKVFRPPFNFVFKCTMQTWSWSFTIFRASLLKIQEYKFSGLKPLNEAIKIKFNSKFSNLWMPVSTSVPYICLQRFLVKERKTLQEGKCIKRFQLKLQLQKFLSNVFVERNVSIENFHI